MQERRRGTGAIPENWRTQLFRAFLTFKPQPRKWRYSVIRPRDGLLGALSSLKTALLSGGALRESTPGSRL